MVASNKLRFRANDTSISWELFDDAGAIAGSIPEFCMEFRSHLKKVFSSDIGVEPSSQVLDILEYACGMILGLALISTENPNFEMASIN